jgi:hypothetical protein
MQKIIINKIPSFHEVWHEGFIEHEDKKHYFWLIHPQALDVNGEEYELEVRWFFSKVPKEVRALYPQIINSFKQQI